MNRDDKSLLLFPAIICAVAICIVAALLIGNMYGSYGGLDCERACGAGRVAECGKTIKCMETGR